MSSQRSGADLPVFIVGCARSGTTLMYHTLISSGGFANYRSEPAVFDLCMPRFGDLTVLANRKKLVESWSESAMFRASGLKKREIGLMLRQCTSGGAFLSTLMGEVARSQGRSRWAVWGPDNLLYIPRIKKELPNARFIHMLRDGRDVAVSLSKERWIQPLPLDKKNGLQVAALHWLWKVERGREHGKRIKSDYLEVRYEDLVSNPHDALRRISSFIEYDLDYDYIRNHAIGTLVTPNSSFSTVSGKYQVSPVQRWKQMLSPADTDMLLSVLGPMLHQLGYPIEGRDLSGESRIRFRKIVYSVLSDFRLWCKTKTPLGRLTDTSRFRLEKQPVEDH